MLHFAPWFAETIHILQGNWFLLLHTYHKSPEPCRQSQISIWLPSVEAIAGTRNRSPVDFWVPVRYFHAFSTILNNAQPKCCTLHHDCRDYSHTWELVSFYRTLTINHLSHVSRKFQFDNPQTADSRWNQRRGNCWHAQSFASWLLSAGTLFSCILYHTEPISNFKRDVG